MSILDQNINNIHMIFKFIFNVYWKKKHLKKIVCITAWPPGERKLITAACMWQLLHFPSGIQFIFFFLQIISQEWRSWYDTFLYIIWDVYCGFKLSHDEKRQLITRKDNKNNKKKTIITIKRGSRGAARVAKSLRWRV